MITIAPCEPRAHCRNRFSCVLFRNEIRGALTYPSGNVVLKMILTQSQCRAVKVSSFFFFFFFLLFFFLFLQRFLVGFTTSCFTSPFATPVSHSVPERSSSVDSSSCSLCLFCFSRSSLWLLLLFLVQLLHGHA